MGKGRILMLAGVALVGAPATAEPLATALKLTADQQPLYSAWESARRGDPQALQRLADDRLAARTAPDLTALWTASAEYNLTWSRAFAAASRRLYDRLTAAQRSVFDAALLPNAEKDAPAVDDLPMDPKPTLSDPHAAARINPEWSRKPDGADLAVFYPLRAQQEHKAGSATVTCDVRPNGVPNSCVVDREEPAGYGFGNATIEAAGRFRFHPATIYGVPTDAKVTVPLTWQLEPAHPPAVPCASARAGSAACP